MWWTKYARCKNFDPEIFFPISDKDTDLGMRQQRTAKQICGSCPVHRECLAFALKTQQAYGVWGGLSETERRSLVSATR
jgi:WhiB family redox-sensing transcriptional regulator